MATQSKPAAPKTDKPKAPPKTVVQRVTEQLKTAALKGKITSEELDVVTNLAGALKTFIKA